VERAAPPRRRLPSVGDAVGFFAALLGLVLLAATARHLFWSDPSVAIAPGDVPALAQVAPAAAPVAHERVDRKATARAHPARPAVTARHVARQGAPQHDAQRQAPLRQGAHRHATHRYDIARDGRSNGGAYPSAARAVSRNERPRAIQRDAHATERDVHPRNPRDRSVSKVRPAAQSARRSQPVARRSERRPQPIAQTAAVHARQNVLVARGGPKPRAVRIAALSSRHPASPPDAFVATRAQRRARARQAAIIEPPLGFQTHITPVAPPGALGLDLGRDPIPVLRILRKHRH
jgi:hypothetical protein